VREGDENRPGAFAEVVVFDLVAGRDRATYERPHQRSEGMRFALVNGQVALADGHPSPSRTGRVLRRERL
jgi:N-acyl-D-amino-acid deacylase